MMKQQWIQSKIKSMVVACAAIAIVAGSVRAATIQTADEKTISATISGYENGKLILQPKESDATTKLPLADITLISYTWQERVAATPNTTSSATRPKSLRWQVEFGGTDRLTATLVAWNETGVCLASDTLVGEFVIPADQLRSIWTTTDNLVKKAKEISITARGQDIAYVSKDGEVKAVAGFATGCDGEFLNFKYDGQDHGIKLDRLVGLVLAQREIPAEREMYETFMLSTPGEMISGRITGMDKDAFHVTVLGGGDVKKNIAVPIAKIDKIAVKNGRLVWLGDLKPALVQEVPYLDYMMSYRVNQSLTGGPLKMQDTFVDRGIAVHSKCFLTYDLSGAFEKLRMTVGFQQPEGKMGRAALRVLGDEKVLWEDLDAKGDGKSVPLDLNIQGVKMLRLEADYGKDQDVGDRVIWGDARLTKPAK
ncbi:MAG: NPCBM/NEW2 domain-containing protein [Phycisphaerales bacterium]|nr:NPCBM/NEW2 domain-containing protein [Phycisphaerales bacterium]